VNPRVILIILNWNGRSDTLECLESLLGLSSLSPAAGIEREHPSPPRAGGTEGGPEPPYAVTVVDNGSTDGSVAAIQARFPHVRLIENDRNLGFVGGNNVGLRHALEEGADYALLLNNDTVVDPSLVRLLVEVADSNPDVGVAGPTICYYDRPDCIWSAGGAIDWRQGRTRMIGLNERDVGQFGHSPREVDFVTGCAMLVRRAALEQVGLLDERFFAYYEDAEWCVRMRRAGFKVVHVPEARLWHKITPERRADSPVVHYYMTRNRLLFLKATGASGAAWLHTLFAEYLRTLLSWTVRPRWQARRAQRNAMLKAVFDFAVGRTGPVRIQNTRSLDSGNRCG